MDRWFGKVAVVTGASSGIGEAIAVGLVKHGLKVVGLARRIEKLREIADRLKNEKGSFHPVQCDVTKEEDILEAFRFARNLGGVDILVNNAGVAYNEPIIDGSTEHFENCLDINVLSVAICTREATKSMRERGSEGHIINMNSVVSRNSKFASAQLNLYQPSKQALAAITELVRCEIAAIGAPIKITNLAPGFVKTEMPAIIEGGGEQLFAVLPYLECKDVVDTVIYILGTPPNVEIGDITVTALHDGVPRQMPSQ